MEVAELITAWMEFLHIQKGHLPRGVEKYAVTARSFFAWLDQAATSEAQAPTAQGVARTHIEAWQKALFFDFHNMSNKVRAGKLSALRSFFGWLVYAGVRRDDPTRGIPSPKFRDGNPQIFSTTELRMIFSSPDRTTLMGVRDYAVLRLLHAAGPRITELCNLDICDVHDGGRQIRVHFRVKNGRDRDVILKSRFATPLREWLIARTRIATEHQALFISLRGGHTRMTIGMGEDIIKKSAKLAGVTSDVFCHKMRSTFATDLYDATGDLLTVQLALGHKRTDTTLRYIAVSKRHLSKLALPNSRMHEIDDL